jgi:hypothetical protein
MQTNRYILSGLIDRIVKKGVFFGAVYQKKDGAITKVNARFGVTKHLKGGKRTIPQNMYVVWDSNRKRYTALDPERIQSITYQGLCYGIADAE